MDSDIVSGEYLYRKAYGIFEKARVRCTVYILYSTQLFGQGYGLWFISMKS